MFKYGDKVVLRKRGAIGRATGYVRSVLSTGQIVVKWYPSGTEVKHWPEELVKESELHTFTARIASIAEKIAYSPIRVDRRTVKDIIDEFFKFVEWAAKSQHPEQPFGVLTILAKEVEMENVKGERLSVVIKLVSKPDSSDEPVIAGGAGFTTSGGVRKPAAFINVNGNFNALQFLGIRRDVEIRLDDLISHELVHLADVRMDEPSAGKTFRQVPDISEVNMQSYANHPAEVRAYMRTIVNQVQRAVDAMRNETDVHRAVDRALKMSRTWAMIEEYLNEKNRRIILDAVYRAVAGAIQQRQMAASSP
jgi:hypothetical protein